MVRALTVPRPTPRLTEAARTERAFAEFEQALLQKFESELANNKDANTQTGPYLRKKLMTQLLSARRNDPAYLPQLLTRYPNFTKEINEAAAELAAWTSPLAIRATNKNVVADQLIWPTPANFPSTLQQQAQSGNSEYRRR